MSDLEQTQSLIAVAFMLCDELDKLNGTPQPAWLSVVRAGSDVMGSAHREALGHARQIDYILREGFGFDRRLPRPVTEADWQSLAASLSPRLAHVRACLLQLPVIDADTLDRRMAVESARATAEKSQTVDVSHTVRLWLPPTVESARGNVKESQAVDVSHTVRQSLILAQAVVTAAHDSAEQTDVILVTLRNVVEATPGGQTKKTILNWRSKSAQKPPKHGSIKKQDAYDYRELLPWLREHDSDASWPSESEMRSWLASHP